VSCGMGSNLLGVLGRSRSHQWAQRKTQAEYGARAGNFDVIDGPAVALHHRVDLRQTQAATLVLGGEERIEDALALLQRHARTRIGDIDREPVILAPRVDLQ